MKWKGVILIVLISFGFGIIAGYFFHGHPTFESVRNWIIGGLSFAVMSEVLGFLREFYKEHREKKAKETENQKEIKRINNNLLLEIELNNSILKPISYSVVDALESKGELSKENIFPNRLNFNNLSFSALLDKIGIDDNIRIKLPQYYNELDYIEKEYNKLKLTHAEAFSSVMYVELGKIREGGSAFSEINELLLRTKETCDMGEELIRKLKE